MDQTLDCWHKDLAVRLTGQIGREHHNQPAGFSHGHVVIVIGADHGQGPFCAGVKVTCQNADSRVKATAICRLGVIKCKKDTGELLALAFTPRLNAALKKIIGHQQDNNNAKLASDGTLTVYEKNQGVEGDAGVAGPTFCTVLDEREQLCPHDTLEISVPIHVFITGDLACHTCVLGKEGMDKAHCLWCKLKSVKWQACGHARGVKWTFVELQCVARSLGTDETENGVKQHPLLDCIKIERFVFPVLHVTLSLANRLLKHAVKHADVVLERSPPPLKITKAALTKAQHKRN
jgi:hypothetical protein